MDKLRKYIAEFSEEIVKHRRHIHKNAELSNEEFKTSQYIIENLTKMNIKYERQETSTSIIAYIKGLKQGKKIAFRADMDALPINEETGLEFSSVNKNCMHACGHDAHSAILLGTAKVLKAYEKQIKGEIILIFQAAEEASPKGGAKRIMQSGVLKGVDRIYGLHVWPEANVGEILVKEGFFMAASDYFCIDIQGQSSHAAQPHKGVDALLAASEWVVNIHTLMARKFSAFDNVVLSIGKMKSGSKHNILSDFSHLEGTCRTFKEENRLLVEELIKQSLKSIDLRHKTSSICRYNRGYPALINNKECVIFAKDTMEKYGINVKFAQEASMCAEDYAVYLKDIQGAFLWLGTHYEGCYPLHHSKFSIDENILSLGVLAFCALALEFLK